MITEGPCSRALGPVEAARQEKGGEVHRALRVCAEAWGRAGRLRGAAGRRAVKEATNTAMCSQAEAARTKQQSSCTAFCVRRRTGDRDRTVSAGSELDVVTNFEELTKHRGANARKTNCAGKSRGKSGKTRALVSRILASLVRYSLQATTPERTVAALHSEVDDLGVLLDHLEEVVVV